jgi:hypothetical protein
MLQLELEGPGRIVVFLTQMADILNYSRDPCCHTKSQFIRAPHTSRRILLSVKLLFGLLQGFFEPLSMTGVA